MRLLLATNRDLETAIEEGRFRQDLYFRINVLRWSFRRCVRGTDTLLLSQHFIDVFAKRREKVLGMSETVAEKLLAYAWPGNVRELRNVIERAVALTRHDRLTVEDLPGKVHNIAPPQVIVAGNDPGELVPLEEVERRYILHVLESTAQNRTLAARTLRSTGKRSTENSASTAFSAMKKSKGFQRYIA